VVFDFSLNIYYLYGLFNQVIFARSLTDPINGKLPEVYEFFLFSLLNYGLLLIGEWLTFYVITNCMSPWLPRPCWGVWKGLLTGDIGLYMFKFDGGGLDGDRLTPLFPNSSIGVNGFIRFSSSYEVWFRPVLLKLVSDLEGDDSNCLYVGEAVGSSSRFACFISTRVAREDSLASDASPKWVWLSCILLNGDRLLLEG